MTIGGREVDGQEGDIDFPDEELLGDFGFPDWGRPRCVFRTYSTYSTYTTHYTHYTYYTYPTYLPDDSAASTGDYNHYTYYTYCNDFTYYSY